MTKTRSVTIDMARGVTIILVAAFHANTNSVFNDTLADLRMPLFFLLTGFLFSKRYVDDAKLLVRNRAISLVLPYLSAALLFYIFWVLRTVVSNDEASLIRSLVGIFYGISPNDWLVINITLWFLVCLFCAQIIFCFMLNFLKRLNDYIQLICFIAISVLGVTLGKVVYLPWSLDVALACQLFLFIGYEIKKYALLDKFKPISLFTLLAVIVFAISAYYNPPINVGFRTYNNIILFYVAGISGSIVVLKLLSLLSSIKMIANILSYIGRESLIILIFHGGLFLYATGVIEQRLGITIHWIIACLISILGSLIIAEIVKRIPILNLLLNGKPMNDKQQSKMKTITNEKSAAV